MSKPCKTMSVAHFTALCQAYRFCVSDLMTLWHGGKLMSIAELEFYVKTMQNYVCCTLDRAMLDI